MDHTIGMILKKIDMGFCGERVSFFHSTAAVDAEAELIAGLEQIQDDKITINLFTREQLKRYSEVRNNPYLFHTVVDAGQEIGIINRKKLIAELKK